jgi:predicted O-linked N-acetylglucosamine transferase (SPINDLY family)
MLDLPDDAVICAMFCQPYKLRPENLRTWAPVFEAVPQAVLWMLDPGAALRARLLALLGAAGIDPARVRLTPPLPQADHLARLACADLVLDTHPVNGHTSTSDALWAGVPVVTHLGTHFASRVAASCLYAMQLQELVAANAEAATARAIALARDAAARQALRARLLAARTAAPLFDTRATTRALESAYRIMVTRQRAGQAPASFHIPG